MKTIVTSIATSILLAALAAAQPPRYTITDLARWATRLANLSSSTTAAW
jgi:hypothetical protein